MEPVQFTLVVLLLISVSTSVLGDAVAYFPSERGPINQFQFIHPQLQPVSRNAILPSEYFRWTPEHRISQEEMVPQENLQPILHTAVLQPEPEGPLEGQNYTVFEAPRMTEEDQFRAAKGYEYPTHAPASYPQAPPYGYNTPPAPNYSPPASAPAAPAYAPPPAAAHHPPNPKFNILKPDLTSLIKPVTTKVAGKVSGLIGLVLSLLTGTASDDLEMKGFKEIVINGIVKPLLVAKGGIKSLISKLTIPVISLLLINLEVLITVWWLWEECPESKPTYEYSKPAYPPNYNSYR